MRVLLCLKSLSANSPLYICTKCFIYYKLVFCVAFFSFRSSTYTLAASFIHFRQLCKRSLFFICVMIYHCYFCDCFCFSFSIMSKNTFLLRFLARLIRNSYLQSFANLLAFVYFDSFSECLACYVCILHRNSHLTDILNVFTRTIQLQCYSVLFQMFFNI